MTRIALKPKNLQIKTTSRFDTLTNAAWQFAYAALWQEQHFSLKETERVRQEISDYFGTHANRQEAFTNFCERIAIVARLLAAEKSRMLPHPSIWFNRHFQEGFSATFLLHREMQYNKEQIPGFCEGICTLSKYYLQFIQKPSGKAFTACRKKLLRLKEYGLIQLFYNSIIYSQLFNPNK